MNNLAPLRNIMDDGVAWSMVNRICVYHTDFRTPLCVCRNKGKYTFVNGIQSFGARRQQQLGAATVSAARLLGRLGGGSFGFTSFGLPGGSSATYLLSQLVVVFCVSRLHFFCVM